MDICGYKFSDVSSDLNIGSISAVYALFIDEDLKPCYIGASDNLEARLKQHSLPGGKMHGLDFKFSLFKCDDIFSFEKMIIEKLNPEMNKKCRTNLPGKHNTNFSLSSETRDWLSEKAKELGLKGGRSEMVETIVKKVDREHEFIKECAEREGLTPEEAEVKSRKFWGF